MAVQAYSDLIYLFLDGEATETERSVLFSALKESPELQEEFASAVSVKGAFVTDALKIQAPTYIEAQIAEKAGLLASKIAAGSAASSALTTAPMAFAPLLMKAGLLLLGGVAAGVIATVAINNNPSPATNADRAARNTTGTIRAIQSQANQNLSNQNSATQSSTNQTQTNQSSTQNIASSNLPINNQAANSTTANSVNNITTAANSPVNSPKSSATNSKTPFATHKNNSSNNFSTHTTSSHSTKNIANNSSLPQTPAKNHSSNASHDRNAKQESVKNINSSLTDNNNSSNNNLNALQPKQAQNATQNAPVISDVKNSSNTQSQIPSAPVLEAATTRQVPMADIIGGSEGNPRNPLIAKDNFSPDPSHRISAYISGNTALAMYPGRFVNDAQQSGINRLSIGVGYDLGFSSTASIEFGRETFPIYLKSANGTLTPNYSITYGGLSFKYTFTQINFPLGIHPYARILGGIATPGPIGKFDLGLSWQANETFSFTLAPEYTGVLFKNDGQLTSGGKSGIVGTMIFHF